VQVTGNNGNALPFFQLSMLKDVFAPGQQAFGLAIESSRWMRAGFILNNQSA
jgi:3-oxoacyl-[acyl-carrier-protein] synthase-3